MWSRAAFLAASFALRFCLLRLVDVLLFMSPEPFEGICEPTAAAAAFCAMTGVTLDAETATDSPGSSDS